MIKLRLPKATPAFVLFILAPTIGELLSGSSPPLELFNPVSFPLLASLYGSGAIIMREAKVRWHKDYRSLLLLGCAYGVLEEGLMVKSFFDPTWMDLGRLGVYGRFADVNWVWAEMLTIYHATISITIPIALTELRFPERREQSWITTRQLRLLIALLAGVTIFGFLALTPYRPPPLQYVLTITIIALLIYAAKKLLPKTATAYAGKKANPRLVFTVAALGSFAFFLLFYTGPELVNSPSVLMLLGLALVLGLERFFNRYDWWGLSSAPARLAATSGGLAFMISVAFLLETRMLGMSIVGIAAIAGLLLLRRRIHRDGWVKIISP